MILKRIFLIAYVLCALLIPSVNAQTTLDRTVNLIQEVELYFKENKACPTGYRLTYIKCGNELKPSCMMPEAQNECDGCWEVHWGPCAGKTSGGMWFYNTLERANRVAYLSSSTSYCPWYESSNYMIVLNDPKGCLSKPTGYEMVSWSPPIPLQNKFESITQFPVLADKENVKTKSSTDDMDGFLEELIEDNGLSTDAKTTQQLEEMKLQNQALLKQAEEDKKNELNTTQGTVGLRGLAGKIESGEYDPYNTNKNTTANGQINQNAKDSTKQSTGESYVIFWVGSAAYGWGTTVMLNGQTFRPTKRGAEINRQVDSKATIVLSKLGSAPTCSDEPIYTYDAISNSILMYCESTIIKSKVASGFTNNWTADVLVSPGQFQKRSGSFVAKPGCNIIEIK